MKHIKKIALLILLAFCNLIVFSQKDTTTNDSLVCIKKEIAKKIAKDLVKLDECLEQKTVLDNNILLLNNQLKNKDSVIILLNKTNNLSNQSYINACLKYDIVNKQVLDTNKKLKWSKFKTTISQILLLSVITVLAFKN